MSDRVCPFCGHRDQPGAHILAVFQGRQDSAMLGGCSCPACNGLWLEYAYRYRSAPKPLLKNALN